MSNRSMIAEFDAREWVKEFSETFPEGTTRPDDGTMLAWFSNAIMAGYDYHSKMVRKVMNESSNRLPSS